MASAARQRSAPFSAELGFVLNPPGIARQVELFCTTDSARQALNKAFGSRESEIPPTFSGTVQNATLFLLSPQLNEDNFVHLYGPALWHDGEYQKLILHELLHSAHELGARQLFGSEDGMGPQWLFEGLAMVASGQLPIPQAEWNQLTVTDFNNFLRSAQKDDPSTFSTPGFTGIFSASFRTTGSFERPANPMYSISSAKLFRLPAADFALLVLFR
jgi:hypothetical protein